MLDVYICRTGNKYLSRQQAAFSTTKGKKPNQKALGNRTENMAKSECYKGTSWLKVTKVPSKTSHKLENVR